MPSPVHGTRGENVFRETFISLSVRWDVGFEATAGVKERDLPYRFRRLVDTHSIPTTHRYSRPGTSSRSTRSRGPWWNRQTTKARSRHCGWSYPFDRKVDSCQQWLRLDNNTLRSPRTLLLMKASGKPDSAEWKKNDVPTWWVYRPWEMDQNVDSAFHQIRIRKTWRWEVGKHDPLVATWILRNTEIPENFLVGQGKYRD